MIRNIAFIGATGMIGRPVAQALHYAGFNVTALVRDVQSAQKKLPSTIGLVPGDLKDKSSLSSFLKDQDALYLNLNLQRNEKRNAFHAETDGLKNVIAALEGSSIQRIGFISSLVMRYQHMNGFNWWVFDVKQEAVSLIKSAGVPYTIFYPSTFMENFHSTYRMGNRVLLAGTSHHKMFFISGIDFGKQVAKAFLQPHTENREYSIQGPEGLTADEAANIFVKHHTKYPLKISRAPLGLLRFFGNFSREASYGAHIIEALNNYPEKFESQQTWTELGTPVITLRDFAEGRHLS